MPPKITKNPKIPRGKKRKKDPPPVESDDSTSGSERESGELEPDDAEKDNTTRLSKSAVHDEYLQPSETFEVKSKSGKKIKVTKWKSS